MARLSPTLLIVMGALVIFISIIVNKWSLFGPMTIFMVVGFLMMVWGVIRIKIDGGREVHYVGDTEYDHHLTKRDAEDQRPHDSAGLRMTRQLMDQQEQRQRQELQQQYRTGLSGQQGGAPSAPSSPVRQAPAPSQPQPMGRYCMKCKTPLHLQTRFCPHCGTASY